MVLEHSAPRLAKSAERIEGAMIALGAIVAVLGTSGDNKGLGIMKPLCGTFNV
jgi:hypothetical protein